ncbi:MAG: glycosyltransferase family 2 protein [Nanoarchaeota archaeon]|nr:glycosyltransferase family 2 protein [Nanoarchaeota archaeon]
MAADIIMIIGVFVFGGLFLFLALVFITSFISLFKKPEKHDHEPSVSVVIPCYNEEKNIKQCLDSISALNYNHDKIEILVVDDGSTDHTLKILRLYRSRHPLKIIPANHGGKSESLNIGIKKSRNEIIFTVDADTILDKDALRELVRPFHSKKVGATNGSCIVRNRNSLLSYFQNVEYHYNNLIRKSFSVLFNEGIWFYGAFACYRRKVLEKIGYFKKECLTEDADIALEIYSSGYKMVNVHDAFGYVLVPSNLIGLVKQRARWWAGVLQALKKNKHLFSRKSSPSIIFLFLNQYWWSFYALISLPLIAYQVYYWLPYNTETFYMLFMYLFRWFTLLGPAYVIYKIPDWGLSIYSVFGVFSGIISILLIIKALILFRDKSHIKNLFGLFFYFPYTIILNIIVLIGLIKLIFLKEKYFID